MTLALFEDLRGPGGDQLNAANYDQAFHNDELDWGYKSGCDFVTKPCMANGVSNHAEFCSGSVKDGTIVAGEDMCNHNARGIGKCNLVTHGGSLDQAFQYFSEPIKGGSDPLTDFCPYINPWSNRKLIEHKSLLTLVGLVSQRYHI